MVLHEQQRVFLARRQKFLRWWTPLGSLLLAATGIFWLWLMLTSPLLVNPLAAAQAIESDKLQWVTIELMASLLPWATSIAFALLATLIVFMFAAMSQQRKMLAMIDPEGSVGADDDGPPLGEDEPIPPPDAPSEPPA